MKTLEEILNIWGEKVLAKADESLAKAEDLPYEYKRGMLKGYAEGLIMATSILSRLEQVHTKKKEG